MVKKNINVWATYTTTGQLILQIEGRYIWINKHGKIRTKWYDHDRKRGSYRAKGE